MVAMAGRKVLPLIITVTPESDASQDLKDAFLNFGEPAEHAKIAHWASTFEFEPGEPFVIDLTSDNDPETLTEAIVRRAKEIDAKGVVVAGATYLRRVHILETLHKKLCQSQLELWGANLGSNPITDLRYT
jgi:hypothetical protein